MMAVLPGCLGLPAPGAPGRLVDSGNLITSGGLVQWLNAPAQWSEQRGSLAVAVGAATDFWRIAAGAM